MRCIVTYNKVCCLSAHVSRLDYHYRLMLPHPGNLKALSRAYNLRQGRQRWCYLANVDENK